jgi:hypothetical protein
MRQVFNVNLVINVESDEPVNAADLANFLRGSATIEMPKSNQFCITNVKPEWDKIKFVAQLKHYDIPVTWTVRGNYSLYASSLEDAKEIVLGGHPPCESLPKGEFVDDTFKIDHDEIYEEGKRLPS